MPSSATAAGAARFALFFAAGTFATAAAGACVVPAVARTPVGVVPRAVAPLGVARGAWDDDMPDAPTGSRIAVAVTETAHPMGDFLDSVGVNTHFSYENSGYTTNFSQAAHMLVAAGIRHIRDGMHEPYEDGQYVPRLQQLSALGIKGTFFVSEDQQLDGHLMYTAAEVQGYPAQVGSVFARYEAPNEQDLNGGPNWLLNIGPVQQELWNDVHGSQQSAGFPVLGPSLTRVANYLAVGNLSQYLDDGNIHDYLYGYHPETTGYHDGQPIGGYGQWWDNITGTMAAAAAVSGAKPIVATETGYCTSPTLHTFNNLTDRAQEAYALRLYTEQFAKGVRETDFFQYIDVPQYDGPDYGYCGLLTAQLQPKPAYYAVKNLMHLLADSGHARGGVQLTVGLSANGVYAHHLLLQHSSGALYLLLWRCAKPWIPQQNNPGWPHATGMRTVSVALQGNYSAVAEYQFDDRGALVTTPLQSQTAFPVALDDKLTILQLTPG